MKRVCILSQNGWSSIMLAAELGNEETVQVLLDSMAKLNEQAKVRLCCS